VELPGGILLEFQPIPAGTFMMGSPKDESGREDDEIQHEVTISKPFYLGRYEVTQEQYQAVMGKNPRRFKGNRRSVENVSWEDAMAFCRKASELTGEKFRLPTEAEWEYACRAGTTTAFNTGTDLAKDQTNFDGGGTVDVGSFRPNVWGLYDMHGNVWEWCSDWYGGYDVSKKNDPRGAAKGTDRVLRGGSWFNNAGRCRSASRGRNDPGSRRNRYGVRVVLDK
jgi:formylglycine-generating enzyme required for sulfatase activity